MVHHRLSRPHQLALRPAGHASPTSLVRHCTIGLVVAVTLLAGCGKSHRPSTSVADPPSADPPSVAPAPSVRATDVGAGPNSTWPGGTGPLGGTTPVGTRTPGWPSVDPTSRPTGGATGTGRTFPATTAVPCAGVPGPDQIVALLRRPPAIVPDSLTVQVLSGPLCAADWQYTVVAVTGRDPLRVVSRGAPTALTLISAGSDVCTEVVLLTAPIGIRTVAGCDVG